MTQGDGSSPATVPDSVRKARLAEAMQKEVLAGGRIEAQGEFNAVIRFGKPVNHILHLLLTIVTGLWALVWILMAIENHNTNYAVTLIVNEYADISRQSSRFMEQGSRQLAGCLKDLERDLPGCFHPLRPTRHTTPMSLS